MKNKRNFYGLGGVIYPTLTKYTWQDGSTSMYGDFYFLPMFRYMTHGTEDKWLQFRWLVWGINIKLK